MLLSLYVHRFFLIKHFCTEVCFFFQCFDYLFKIGVNAFFKNLAKLVKFTLEKLKFPNFV
jgi:hypothetical protein